MHVWHNKYTHTNTWQRLITETMIRQLPVQIKWSIEGFLHVILLSCHKQRVYKYRENSLNFGGVVCYGCLYLPVAHCSILWPFRLEPLDSPDLVWLLHRQGCGSVDQCKRCCLALLNQQIKGMQLQWKKPVRWNQIWRLSTKRTVAKKSSSEWMVTVWNGSVIKVLRFLNILLNCGRDIKVNSFLIWMCWSRESFIMVKCFSDLSLLLW